MALQRTRGAIPKDAVSLTEKEARAHQWKMVQEWTPKRDTWPFRYGVFILSASAALSSFMINNHFRNKLRLMSYGRVSSYLPIVVLPSLACTLFHYEFVTSSILVFKNECPTCLQLKASAIQCACGTVYPFVMAPLASFAYATRYLTYNVPNFLQQPQLAAQLLQKLSRPLMGKLGISFLAQMAVATILTHMEAKSLYKMYKKMGEIETDIVY